jgi:hypothetical protein
MLAPLGRILPLLLISLTLAGCQAIADIFQAGVWVGVVLVLVVLGAVAFFVSKARGR